MGVLGKPSRDNTCGFVTTTTYERLKAENEKLRNLVCDMSLPYRYGDVDCGLCPHTDKCWDSETLDFNPDGCVILQMVRELGIEV